MLRLLVNRFYSHVLEEVGVLNIGNVGYYCGLKASSRCDFLFSYPTVDAILFNVQPSRKSS